MGPALAPWLIAVAAGLAGDSPKVESYVELLTDQDIGSIALDPAVAGTWLRPAIERVEARYRDEARPRDVMIQVELTARGPARASAAGRPALDDKEAQALVGLLDLKDAPKTKVGTFALRLFTKVNGGPADDKAPYLPAVETPDERRSRRFREAGTPERLALMRAWARDEALPILAAFTSSVDPKFAGVRGVGAMLAKLDASRPIDVEALTERNPAYWRAVMEMAPGIPMIPCVRACLHVADGEIDKARRHFNLARMADAGKSGPSRLLAELEAMLRVFYRDVEGRIAEGIRLHDRGKYAEALAIYDAVLKDYPGSPWALYERFHTRQAQAMAAGKTLDEAMAGWPAARKAILAADPLYGILAVASGPAEIHQLLRRRRLDELFKDPKKQREDLRTYAEIALDLGEYGVAAQVDWMTLGSADEPGGPGFQGQLELFLFCLEKLGVTGLKTSFRGDHAAAFARIEAQIRKRIEDSPASGKDGQAGRPAKE